MKRLKLKEKPKRLNLSSPVFNEPSDIEVLLEQYHNNTKENKNLPYFKWISLDKHLPLDIDEPVLVYGKRFSTIYDSKSYIVLQHYLHSKMCGYGNEPSHWMRLKLPEV